MPTLPSPGCYLSRSSVESFAFVNWCRKYFIFFLNETSQLLLLLVYIADVISQLSDKDSSSNGVTRKKASHVPLMSRETERKSYHNLEYHFSFTSKMEFCVHGHEILTRRLDVIKASHYRFSICANFLQNKYSHLYINVFTVLVIA